MVQALPIKGNHCFNINIKILQTTINVVTKYCCYERVDEGVCKNKLYWINSDTHYIRTGSPMFCIL